ncbi:ImmA/IrrE family metallo-endopeptidase [Novosphingobium sp. AAP83]|uniref:ImmA/IrrE family metallo-endopeptidase n=1 Tax=Novosphingobium sp. AAP83 TaxID=1523425 RepID=UPI0009E7A5FD|nr:ImmA/IrrE family metallo-endopeptidase [Novosphingobium sp. AAP83]
MATHLVESDLVVSNSFSTPEASQGTKVERFKPSRLRPAEIKEIAEQLAARLHISPKWNPFSTVKELNGRIEGRLPLENFRNPTQLSVGIEGGSFTINVVAGLKEDLERYIIAKQLGHYFLHVLYSGVPVNKRSGNLDADVEAEIFALNFLMPHENFARYASDLKEDYSSLATFYGLPEPVVYKRQGLLNSG